VSEALGTYEGTSPLRRPLPLRRRRKTGLPWLFAWALLRALLLVGAPGGIVVWLLYSPYFLIREVRVDGGARVSAEWVESNLRPLVGRHILAVSLEGVQQRLSAHPWVASVELRRELPDRLGVVVVERMPVALLATDGGRAFLDAEGHTIVPCPPDGGQGMLLVRHPFDGAVPVQAVLDVVAELQRAEPAWGLATREVEILGDGEYRVDSAALPYPMLLKAGTVGEAAINLRRVLPEIERRFAAVELLDLRQPRRLVVRPGPTRQGTQ
jgi:cell division septal protein FtsQ